MMTETYKNYSSLSTKKICNRERLCLVLSWNRNIRRKRAHRRDDLFAEGFELRDERLDSLGALSFIYSQIVLIKKKVFGIV